MPDSNEQENYEAQVKAGITDPYPYDRLMIIYRKQKKYKAELRVVKKAIAVFQKQLDNFHKEILKGNRRRTKILELSRSIREQTGLVDKKGNTLHVPEPIARWLKRKAVIEKKLG